MKCSLSREALARCSTLREALAKRSTSWEAITKRSTSWEALAKRSTLWEALVKCGPSWEALQHVAGGLGETQRVAGGTGEVKHLAGGPDEVQHLAGGLGEVENVAALCSWRNPLEKPVGEACWQLSWRSPWSPRGLEAHGRPVAGQGGCPPGGPGAHRDQFLQGFLVGGRSTGIYPCKGSWDSKKVAGRSSSLRHHLSEHRSSVTHSYERVGRCRADHCTFEISLAI